MMSGSEWFESRPGGLNRYFGELFAALTTQDDARTHAVAFGKAPTGGRSWGAANLNLLRRLSRATVDIRNADVVDRHFSLYGRLPLLSARRKRVVKVVHFHGPWAAESRVSGGGRFSNWAKRRVEISRYAAADVLIVLSEAFKELLVESYGVPASKVRVVPPGVRVNPNAVARPTPDRPIVLCVRRLERRMGIDDLLVAWRAVMDAHPTAELRIIGDGSQRAALREKSNALGLGGSVSFLGRVSDDELQNEYGRSALTVVPTRALEGFGLIALESLANGKAPIVTDCGGLPDSVRTLDATLIVPVGSPKELGRRISAGLSGALPSFDECRQHAAQFSWDRVARAHISIYEEFLVSKS